MRTPGTIAVTGAAGMLGLNLVAFFHARGWSVRAFERRPAPEEIDASGDPDAMHHLDDADDRDDADGDLAPTLTFHRGDLPDDLDAGALAGVDVLVHAAWATRTTDATEARRTNEQGTRTVVDAARSAGVRRLVFVSSTSAHEAALSDYGRSKHRAEAWFDGERDLVVRSGLILSEVGGLFQRLRTSIERSKLVPLFGGGRQILQTIHVDDFCVGLERAIARDVGGRLTLAEPEGLPFRDFVAAIAARLDRRRVRVPVPYAPALLALRATERFGLKLPVSSENLLGLKAMRHVSSRDDLARLAITVRTARESLDDLLGPVG